MRLVGLRGASTGAGAAGMSTSGAQATAQLRLLAAKLIANVPRFEGPEEFGKHIQSDTDRWKRVVKETGFKIE